MTDQSHSQTQTSTSTTTGVFALLRAKPGLEATTEVTDEEPWKGQRTKVTS
jgi:hypothetical protein